MNQAIVEISLVASLVAAACALPGCFLVLRRMSLVSDAISHTVLFGIVVGFLLIGDTRSPLLILFAAGSGILAVLISELLLKTRRVREDAAIGLVFPLLFSVAVIIITRNLSNVHIDTDAVLLGEVVFAPFNRAALGGINLPRGVWVMGAILLINLVLLALFYKELKLSTFDPGLAAALGFAPTVIHYGLMTSVSVTAVGAFDHVGAVLVVALMIAPPASAYLLTDRLSRMLLYSVLIAIASALCGYAVARALDLNISGTMATFTGIFFVLALLFAPERGLVAKTQQRERRKQRFAVETLLVHLNTHELSPDAARENSIPHLTDELSWQPLFAQAAVQRAREGGYISERGETLLLTPTGREIARQRLGITAG